MKDVRSHGIYAITDPVLCGEQLIDKVQAAIQGGIHLLQFRNMHASGAILREEAAQLLSLCHKHNVLFMINDNIDLASEIGADGVHLGQKDQTLIEARERLGENKIIGISCNNRLDYAITAQQQGADYIAFGRFFTSKTKPQAPQADIDLLHRSKEALHLPIVAIGGITPDNGRSLIEAGADMLAVIHGIFGQADVRVAARRYAELFRN